MELYIKDRLYFGQILPQQNSFMEYALKRGIFNKVLLSDKDQEYYEIKHNPENGNITWNVEKDLSTPINVYFTKEELAYIKKGCEALADNPCPDEFWNLVERVYEAANK